MDDLDRLGWAAALVFSAYGVPVGVRTDDPAVLDRVRPLLPPGAQPSEERTVSRLYSLVTGEPMARPGVRPFSLLYVDSLRAGRRLGVEELLPRLESDLHLHVAEWARERVFLHAGVVGWKGRALVLPGASHAGKSTLVAALLRAGARYYSDEFAVMDAQGRVHPFARPLGLRDGSAAWPSRRVAPEALNAEAGEGPLPVGAVVLTRFVEGGRWRVERLPAALAVLRLVEHAVPARRKPAAVLSTLHTLVDRAPVWTGERGDAADSVDPILSLLEEDLDD